MNKTNTILFLLLAVINTINLYTSSPKTITTSLSPAFGVVDSYTPNILTDTLKKQQTAFDIPVAWKRQKEIKRITSACKELFPSEVQDTKTASVDSNSFLDCISTSKKSACYSNFEPRTYDLASLQWKESYSNDTVAITDNNSLVSDSIDFTKSSSSKTAKPLVKKFVRSHQKAIQKQLIGSLTKEVAKNEVNYKEQENFYAQKLAASELAIKNQKTSDHCKLMATTCSLGFLAIALCNKK